MINIKKYRGEFILHPTVPTGTETIDYQVRVNSTVVYAGQTRWFGDEYTVDLKDWIDSYITREEAAGRQVYQVTVVVDFVYTDEDNISSGQSIQYTWTPEVLGADLPMPVQSQTCPRMYIELSNSGFIHYDQQTSKVKIPLMCQKGRLICRNRNRLIKTTYMDKYGDTHNGSMDNRYELEVYVDPDWLGVQSSNNSYRYECVMLALQNALSASMKCEYFITIPGFFSSSTTDMPGRVKDIESVDVRTYYNADHKVPTLKITYEIYK